ncbi:MAG: helix-turn-helix domain-containing protein [Desulfovibrio sp.]|jgi:transcriptional regulator with XRE-family HTH domain|nr:helix-turn-helix domain-containing protein [Desulfovibrio sp.]
MDYIYRFGIIKEKIRKKLADEGKRDTDEAVAEFLQTSKATYRRWKPGQQFPDTQSLILMADKLGISLDWLLMGKGEGDPEGLDAPVSTIDEPGTNDETALLCELLAEKDKRLADKEKIIALQEEKLLQQIPVPTAEEAQGSAPISQPAVRLSPSDSE